MHRTTAVTWYRKAAEQGEMVAQTNRGNAYCNGDGVPVDKSEAVKWYQKAAEQGEFHAQINLTLMDKTGDGVIEA
ncbi:tetratricopeptide repeat protein [Phyllobacterium zundukense]|uniref:Sel1 repeat family protein n=1 Tax=Phyllobacterium zundukense TaxID=1867719 RepID=A0ACD4CZU4_9HYPH|nr:tetratricopeptide repeat protein [Phyllobacterium zundukense]UXN59086.1 sel1 repeat family protein [Phyllobacterium zundukense]